MMGFQAAGFNKTLQNLARVTPAVIAELVTAIELTQNTAVTAAKKRHEAAREKIPGSRKKRVVPSEGGENRKKNPDGTPRYGDITGLLTRSIRAMAVKGKSGKKPFLRGRVRAGVGPKVKYAAAVEFGGLVSRKGSARAGSDIVFGFRKPHPFMRPALRTAARWERRGKVFATAVNRGMKQAVK